MSGYLPPVQGLDAIVSFCIQDAQEVRKNGLPDPKLEFMKKIWHKQRKKVEVKRVESSRECVLDIMG